jgi:hypothetical protein
VNNGRCLMAVGVMTRAGTAATAQTLAQELPRSGVPDFRPSFIRPRGEGDAAARAWIELLEDVVRDHPTQWFNFFDVWSPFDS